MITRLKTLIHKPFILFSPFLIYYLFNIKLNKWPKLFSDEIRYVDFAHNLLHGFYSLPAPKVNLWNGPGYPILILPFIALKIPVLYIAMLNGLFFYLTLILLYKSIQTISDSKIALIFCLLLGVYPNAMVMLPVLYTEAFTGLLISLFVYLTQLYFLEHKTKYGIAAGLVLGYLMLTKIIFGYVAFVCLLVLLITLIFKKERQYCLKAIKVFFIALLLSTPYLVYTYSLTGKVFYWGNSGGLSLYWMSTPFENEYGDWKVPNLSNNQYPKLFTSNEVTKILKKNHAADIKLLSKYNEVEQDAMFKKLAINNIKNYPFKFAANYINNFSRMLFNFPYSYAYQDAAIVRNILIGSFIFWMAVCSIITTVYNWKLIIFPVKLLLLILGVYLLLSGALSAYPRQFDVIMPVFLFWVAYLIGKLRRPAISFSQIKNPALND